MTAIEPLGQLSTVSLRIDDAGVAWLTLERREAANARNQRMREELLAVYEYLAVPGPARVLVLTGGGSRHFCAGMDLKEAAAPETSTARRERLRAGRDIDRLAALPLPTIAAINGAAMGGGLEMALACDLRIVADEAVLGLPELTHGLVPGGGATQRLPRIIGTAAAYELLYLGRRLTGVEASELGLATRSVPQAMLRDTVDDIAARIAALPASAVRHAKALVTASATVPIPVGLEMELDALLALMAERDAIT